MKAGTAEAPDGRGARVLALVLVVSLALLRVVLASRGGQYFFGDEQRYDRGVALYRALSSADWREVRSILAMPEHSLFPLVGAAVTAVQHLLAQFTRFGDWSRPENIQFTMWLGASVLALGAALNVLLVHRVARAAGADRDESVWCALVFAAANAPFFYARHLLPYHVALGAALLSVAVGLRVESRWRAIASGLLAASAYGLYNGYWYLIPITGIALVSWWRTTTPRAGLALAWLGGVTAGLLVPVAVGTALGGAAYWQTLFAFSRSVTQGVYAEGWSLPWAFLWHAEGMLGVTLVVIVLLAIGRQRRCGAPVPPRVILAFGALAGSYGLLVLFSDALHAFVVYGRSTLPFFAWFALAAGWSLSQLMSRAPRLRPIGLLAITIAAVANFTPHFLFVFPRELEIDVMRQFGNPKRALSFSGSVYLPVAAPVTRPDLALVNAQFLYPIKADIGYPRGRDLLRIAHPLAYPAFQYEGHRPRERALLRASAVAMKLVQLADPAGVPDDPPAAVRYHTGDRPDGR